MLQVLEVMVFRAVTDRYLELSVKLKSASGAARGWRQGLLEDEHMVLASLEEARIAAGIDEDNVRRLRK